MKLSDSRKNLLLFIFLALLCILSELTFAQDQGSNGNSRKKFNPFVSFLEKSLLKVPSTREVQVGDLNGDGSPDLLFLTPDPQVFWSSLGDGRGNFALPQKHGFGPGYVNEVVGTTLITGDFDGDGTDELLTFQERRISSESSEAALFLVSSGFKDKNVLSDRLLINLPGMSIVPSDHLFLLSRDINGDNRSDFIFGDGSSQELFVIKNTADLWNSSSRHRICNDIAKIETKTVSKDRHSPFQVLTLDADNDGVTDILRVGEEEIFLIRGDKNELFVRSEGAARPTVLLSQPHGLSWGPNPVVIHGNLNGDKFPDLLIAAETGKSWILLNNKGDSFGISIALELSSTPFVELGDFNGDGFDDLVAYGGGYRGIKILLNGGEGYFSRTIDRPVSGRAVNSLTVSDVNADGLSDIILTLKGSLWGLEGRVLLNISQRVKD